MGPILKSLLASAAITTVSFAAAGAQAADLIPYPNSGDYNDTTYSFTAAADGDIIAYFVDGGGAGYDNQLGLLINGSPSGAGFGLDNHTSGVGDAFNLGFAHAGDTLTFVLHNLSVGADAYSNPSLNAAYDGTPAIGPHNHVYSTNYTQNPAIGTIPKGVYVAFEDEAIGGSDYNYNDESFVFSNALVVSSAPEPATWSSMLLGLGGLGAAMRLRRGRTFVGA